MPGLQSKDRNRIFLIRLAFTMLGVGIAMLYFWANYISKSRITRDIDQMQNIGLLIFGIVVAIGEYVTRRKLRRLEIFPANKRIPWTY